MQPIRVRRAAAALCSLIRTPQPIPGVASPIALVRSRSRHYSTGGPLPATTASSDAHAQLLDGVTFGDYPARTHKCGHLNGTNLGQQVVVTGWAQNIRKFSDELIFLPLRDHSGTVQVVLKGSDPSKDVLRRNLQDLTPESVICVEGRVVSRDVGAVNPNMSTGDIEIDLTSVRVLNKTHRTLPFLPSNKTLVGEEVRLKYRCLDLRRDALQRNLRNRSIAAWVIRDHLVQNDFVEVETPMLFKSTPEGAREFVVPTRNSGSFYALPQSPQQYKQLLMASGMDRYFQIAKCFRDEDLRADRQPEFTQVDLEMSFCSATEIQTLVEGVVRSVWKRLKGVELFNGQPFPRMNYQLAMSKYGSDKPDTRFGLEIQHVADMTNDNVLEAIVLKKSLKLPGSDLKKLALQDNKVFKVNENNIDTWVHKIFGDQIIGHADVASINARLDLEAGDSVILNTRPAFLSGGQTLLGKVRLELASVLQSKGLLHVPASQYNFLWVEGFPLFSPAESTSGTSSSSPMLSATHHPFTAPVAEDLQLLHSSPEKVRGQHYDLVLNGVEIGGGSIRIHSPKLQMFVFEQILKMTPLETSRFSHLIDALSFGCPPHGGLALGFDRMMAILCETGSIRDVIAFPKSASGRDLVVESPSGLTDQQLGEYKIRVVE
ncbi:tRNA synthetases class II-domain-containing protein [Mortierella sp. GBAus27b]|nr:tRNA synthetases class II-domain-containing protein [Mortierella sp. GBAus27b]